MKVAQWCSIISFFEWRKAKCWRKFQITRSWLTAELADYRKKRKMSSRPRVRSQTTTRERSAIPTGHSPRHIIRWCSCNVLCSRTETSRIKLYQLQIQFQRLYVVRQEAIWPDDNALLIAERINNRDGNEAAITQRQAVIYVLYHIHRSLSLSFSLSVATIDYSILSTLSESISDVEHVYSTLSWRHIRFRPDRTAAMWLWPGRRNVFTYLGVWRFISDSVQKMIEFGTTNKNNNTRSTANSQENKYRNI